MQNSIAFRGYLVIFVDGYKMRYKNMTHLFSDGEKTVSVPDRLVPPPNYDVDSMQWWEDGWAVGENQRDRLCGRFGSKSLKKFYDFDEAVSFIYRRQQRHKQHRHILVYVTKTFQGKSKMEVVRSLDDIVAVDAALDSERLELEALQAEAKAKYPHLDMLREKFGFTRGWRLSDILRRIQEGGKEAVIASMPKASWYRARKAFREVGIEI